VDNGPRIVRRPARAWPRVPEGFAVTLYAEGLHDPRLLRVSPGGDVFVSESRPGVITLLRGLGPDGRAAEITSFASGLDKPFGLAFYPPGNEPAWLYVGETDAVVRFPYRVGDRRARGPKEVIARLPAGGWLRGGGHWTRDLVFSQDGKTLFVSVGSFSNNDDPDQNAQEKERADILRMSPTGEARAIYASGIRNAVGLALQPETGTLWASVNERDGLGDDLVPDYVTHIEAGGFYGWPWFYIGDHVDPRHRGKHPELARKVIVPDVLLQPHFASLALSFYRGRGFPPSFRGDIFAAEHGSWNRKVRTGYEVIRIPFDGGTRPTGGYEDFLTGFVTAEGDVWGRPVGIDVAADGALLVSDDAGDVIWRVSYEGLRGRDERR
jgi:glucose/arabinose dehydrogenase